VRLGWVIAGVMAVYAPAAWAQSTPAAPAPAQPAQPPGKVVQGLTVQGRRPDVQRQIDRKSYSLANDQQAATGSLADVLRNIPGLDVDPQGVISIRGDSNVTILVDGQPSPLFQGPGRAQLLQQLPANAYERVEVMTNPSAAFRPEGTGGIINLITKQRRQPGREGSVSAKGVSTDGVSANARGVYVTPQYTLSGVLFATRNRLQRGDVSTRQLVDPASGEVADVGLTTQLDQPYRAWGVQGAASYQLDPTTRLLGDVSYVRSEATGFAAASYRSNVLTGPLAQDYDSGEVVNVNAPIDSASTSLVRTLKGDDHNLTFRVGYSSFSYAADDQDRFDYQLPVQPDLYQDLGSDVSHRQVDLKVEYKAPLSPTSRLDIGYDGELTWDASDNLDRLGTSADTAIVVPALGHAFGFDESVQALFATYQTRFGRLTIMPGVRLEEVSLDIGDAGTTPIRRDYFEVYPTFHMAFALTDRIDLSASYSRRVQRPSGQQLDPFRTYANPLSFSQGNPLLAPEITDSFEAEAVYTKGQSYLSADLFYRDHKDLISNVTENLGGGALLTSYVNEGNSRTAGLELAANAPIAPHLTFNLSTDLFWRQIAVPLNAFERPSSGEEVLVRPKLNWDLTPKDFLQLTLYLHSRAATLQGYTGPIFYTAGGFRHKFNDRLSLDVTVIDPFDTVRVRNVIETPDLTETDNLDLHQRSLSIGLTLALGPHPRPTPRDFDLGAPPAPGAAPVGVAPPVGGGAAP
jgi:outer membrane receptor protein involved in Fe transport